MSLNTVKDLRVFSDLVAELTKENPNQPMVRAYFNQLKLDFVRDPIEQMSTVLSAMEKLELKEPKKEKVIES